MWFYTTYNCVCCWSVTSRSLSLVFLNGNNKTRLRLYKTNLQSLESAASRNLKLFYTNVAMEVCNAVKRTSGLTVNACARVIKLNS